MDDVFRTRYGGIDKPHLSEMQLAYGDSEENDSSDDSDIDDETPSTVPAEDAVVPAWELPKSPYDGVFRKRVGELKHALLYILYMYSN